jgi:hypothetical protein
MSDNSPETDQPEADEPTAPISFTSEFSLLADLARVFKDPKLLLKRMAEFERREQAALAAEKKSASIIAAAREFEHKSLVKVAKEVAELRKREAAVETREWQVAEREEKIRALEGQWRFVGESQLVVRGMQAPEHSALDKARAAYGMTDEAPAADPLLPDAVREDRHGAPFPDHVTLTRQPEV